jgi:hypothetical protein
MVFYGQKHMWAPYWTHIIGTIGGWILESLASHASCQFKLNIPCISFRMCELGNLCHSMSPIVVSCSEMTLE